jgi:hypothetical protein
MRIVLLNQARAELRSSRRWYDEQQDGSGIALLNDVHEALDRIQRDPTLGIRYLGSRFRFHRAKRFPS